MMAIVRLPGLVISLLAVASFAQAEGVDDGHGNPVSISATAFQPRSVSDDAPFTRYDGSLFGLHQANSFTPRDFYPPFFNGGGISSGDINRDGWPDIFGTTYLQGNFYLLSDKGRFTSAGLIQPPRGNSVLSSTASFGDVDRDGDLDAVIGNWFAGASKKHPPPHSQNELWINENGVFKVQALPELVGETLSTLLSGWNITAMR
jgi:hypothetical protein